MPDSQNPEHARKLIQEFQLKGRNLVPTVTGEIVGTVQIADLVERGEVRRYAGTGALQGQVAAQIAAIVVKNPSPSVVIEIVHAQAGSETTQGISAGFIPSLATALSAGGIWQDGTLPGFPAGGLVTFNQGGNPFSNPMIFRVLADTNWGFNPHVTLLEGQAWGFAGLTANTSLFASFIWFERDRLPGE